MPILLTLDKRTNPFTEEEIVQLEVELATLPETERKRTGYYRTIEKKNLLPVESLGQLKKNVAAFQQTLNKSDLAEFKGHIAIGPDGRPLSAFNFSSVEKNDSQIFVSDSLKPIVEKIVDDPDFQKAYFTGANSPLTLSLAVARAAMDHTAEDLNDLGLESEEQRSLLVWEMLARMDMELNGAAPENVLGSKKLTEQYLAVKGFIEVNGLKPMSQFALAIRDGRERVVGLTEGQGANYLLELRDLIEKEPVAKALYNELKPIFASYDIDLDKLLTLTESDQNLIENYYAVSGVTVSLPVVGLIQVLKARVIENHGINFYDFKELSGQSGGLPAAYFMAGAFEQEKYQPPLVPKGVFGSHTREAYENFVKWMLVEGRLMQYPSPIHYDPSVTRFEPLVKNNTPLPTNEEIDAYFKKYFVPNMSISGIAYDPVHPQQSDLGKVLDEVNAKFPDGSSYAFVSNINTGGTSDGKKSHFILVAGKPKALAELAKLVINKNVSGYSAEVGAIVESWKSNPNVGRPITNTRISFAPHDERDLGRMYDLHLETMMDLGIHLSTPRVSIIHNWKGASGDNRALSIAENLADQQYRQKVNVPMMAHSAAREGSVVIGLGAGHYLPGTALPIALGIQGPRLMGVNGKDATGVSDWDRLIATDPGKTYGSPPVLTDEAKVTALNELGQFDGVTVREEDGRIYVRIDQYLEDHTSFLKTFFRLGESNPIFDLLVADEIFVHGKEVKNAFTQILGNRPGMEFIVANSGSEISLRVTERGDPRMEFHLVRGKVLASEFTNFMNKPLVRVFKVREDGRFEQDMTGFAKKTREAYAADWSLDLSQADHTKIYQDTQHVDAERLVKFSTSLQSKDARYVDAGNPDFQAHPHFLIDLMWKAMMTPAFDDKLDLDFTRVIDEGKTIEMGVPVRPGDVITTSARVVKVEDFLTSYEGRRVAVLAEAKNQNGEIVGRVLSTMVSRIATGLSKGETKIIFENPDVKTVSILGDRKTFSIENPPLVAKGDLKIPDTLADSYELDPNRIHISDISAALAGIPKARIMQGLATVAYVNEQVVGQLQRDGIGRAYRGIQNLKFSGFVYPGDKLSYEVSRKAQAEGEHLYDVIVKNEKGSAVMRYETVVQGPKTAVVFTGQGSQYTGMADDLAKDPQAKAMLDELQKFVTKGPDGNPVIDLEKALNAGSQDTSQAQPMILAYSYIIFNRMKEQGLVPNDAVFSGHSLGMWIALLAAGAMKGGPEAAMASVHQRGSAMQAYNDPKNPQGMIAVIAQNGAGPLTKEKVAILQDFINADNKKLAMANDNAPDQVIVGGHLAALVEATPILEAWGYRVVKLGVKNAFHTPLMEQASVDFGTWMESHGNPFQIPDNTLYMDIEAKPIGEVGSGDAATLADIMKRQIATNVEWRATVRRMLSDGVRRFVEVGPASRFDKEKKANVASAGGTLVDLVRKEAAALGVQDSIEVVFANPLINPDNWSKVTLAAAPAKVSEYSKPSVVVPEPKKEVPKTDAEALIPEVVAQAPVAVQVHSPAEISPVQVAATIQGFFAASKDKVADAKNHGALAGDLKDQLVRLGAGARNSLTSRLASLGSAAPAAAGSKSVEDQLIDYFQKENPKVKVTSKTDLDKELNVGSSALADVISELNKLMKVEMSAEKFAGESSVTVALVAKKYEEAGAKDGSGATPGTSPEQVVEKMALEAALAVLPVAAAPMAIAVPSFALVSEAQVNAVREEFVNANKVAIEKAEVSGLVDGLAAKYLNLGAGAVNVFQSRLNVLGVGSVGPVAAAPSKSVEEQLIEYFQKENPKVKVSSKTDLDKELNVGSSALADVISELNKLMKVEMSAEKFAGESSVTVALVAQRYGEAGAKGGATSAPAAAAKLSPADELDRQAIQKALPQLQAMAAAAPVGMAGGVDPAFASEMRKIVAELQKQIDGLKAGLTKTEAPRQAVKMNADGSAVDPKDAEIKRLQTIIDNIIKGTSPAFVYGLMQPNFMADKVFGFDVVARNGGRNNLMKFVADLRMGRLPKTEYDLNARINGLANALDEIGLSWLNSLLENEKRQGDAARISILQTVYDRAADGIKNNTIITGNVVTIRAVNFVPDYGSPNKVVPTIRQEGTIALAEELKPLADPKTPADIDWLLKQGTDLRGTKVLIQQAGTLSGPFIAKLLQQGADVYVTDRLGRAEYQPNGQVTNDYFYDLYNQHAARGAKLTVIPHMQPGNPHDEESLIKYLDENKILPEIYINGGAFSDYGPIEKRGDPHSVLAILTLASRSMALNIAKLHQKHKTDKQVVFMNYYSPNNAGNLAETEGELLPTVIPGSGHYPTAKAALGSGMTAGEAKANGLLLKDGRPILLQVDHKTGWGKSNGDGASIMAGNDFFTMEMERMAEERGFKLLTMTGDQLATVHLAGVLAVLKGDRKGAQHLLYNDTFGFDEAAKRGVLGELMGEAGKAETIKHNNAEADWKARQKKKADPAYVPNDGSLIDLNNLNISVADARGIYARKPSDLLMPDHIPAVSGYGLVGPLGPDALTNYRHMLANGKFKGHEGINWLGQIDFYNLARSMGADVTGWDIEKMAKQLGITEEEVKKQRTTWEKAFQKHLIDNSGFQVIDDFVNFEVVREVVFQEQTEIPVSDPELIKKMVAFGYAFFKKPDGTLVAIAEKGQTYKLPMKYKLPVTIAGALPGHNKFSWDTFGNFNREDMKSNANAARMSKMFTAQILMSMGGYSPQQLQETFGQENIFVGIGTGLGDLKPFNQMTVHPYGFEDKTANYLMAALLPDGTTGQVATEQLGASGMALAVIAACSTGNASIVMAIKSLFSQYYQATKASGEVDWADVFSKVWIAGGVDYALTFNSIVSFDALGALLRDDWRKARELVLKSGSRPDDKERNNFVIGSGGGGQAVEPLANVRARGGAAYSMIIGQAFRTDGNKVGKAREGYGPGQVHAIFEAWDQAKPYLTEQKFSHGEIIDALAQALKTANPNRDDDQKINVTFDLIKNGASKPSQKQAFLNSINRELGISLTLDQIEHLSFAELIEHIDQSTRVLKKNIKLIVMGHKTSTVAGDPYEEASLRKFLSTVLPPDQFAHLVATKAHIGHALGGSSGIDAALTPLILKFKGLPGIPGLDNIAEEGGSNAWLFHARDAVNLNEIYDEKTQFVVVREAAGFNAKNTALIEVVGKIPFEKQADAVTYASKLINNYANERAQKRGERAGLRKMAFNLNSYEPVPVATYADLYEMSLRSDAIAKALMSGRQFDFEKIIDWVYEFPVNKGVELKVDKTASPEIQFNQYNAIKFNEAFNDVADILASFKPSELANIRKEAHAKGWDKQALVFYGASDGMGLRTLLGLIASGAVKEVVGVHLDTVTTNPDNKAVKGSSYNPSIVQALARAKGVNVKVINTNGILYDFKTGETLPLQQVVIDAVNAARDRSKIKDINFFDYVAFGAPWRAHDQDAMFVPTINEFGQLLLKKVDHAKDEAQGIAMTINPMGHNHARLMGIFKEMGWLGNNSTTTTADWWGSETADMLHGVYGGALLGIAKNVAKKEVKEFAVNNPDSGNHVYFGYPSFLSFALNAIPGGTLTGLIAKRIYEDIEAGVIISGLTQNDGMEQRFHSMEELSIKALIKLLKGELSGPNGNKIDVDSHERSIAREIDNRFKFVGEALKDTIEAKRKAFFADNSEAEDNEFKPVLTAEESFELLKDFVPKDYLIYTYQHIKDLEEKQRRERMLQQDLKGTIESLPLSAIFKTKYPFFQRAYGKAMNTPELAISVIDAGGVGTIAADDLKPEELDQRITAVKDAVGSDAALIVNVMMTGANRDAQLEAILKNKPAAVSFGNGLVSKEIVDKLHAAGIKVIQLTGTDQAANHLIEIGVDMIIAERNFGPGHIYQGKGSDPATLIKRIRQAYYEAKIPVIAGGGFVDASDVKGALKWGASAVQLDDPIAYSAESTYAGKKALMEVDPRDAVIEIKDEDGKPLRLLNTAAARELKQRIADLAVKGFDDRTLKPLIATLIARGLGAAAKGDLIKGIYLASQKIAWVNPSETVEQVFKRLTGDFSNPTNPAGGGGGALAKPRDVLSVHEQDYLEDELGLGVTSLGFGHYELREFDSAPRHAQLRKGNLEFLNADGQVIDTVVGFSEKAKAWFEKSTLVTKVDPYGGIIPSDLATYLKDKEGIELVKAQPKDSDHFFVNVSGGFTAARVKDGNFQILGIHDRVVREIPSIAQKLNEHLKDILRATNRSKEIADNEGYLSVSDSTAVTPEDLFPQFKLPEMPQLSGPLHMTIDEKLPLANANPHHATAGANRVITPEQLAHFTQGLLPEDDEVHPEEDFYSLLRDNGFHSLADKLKGVHLKPHEMTLLKEAASTKDVGQLARVTKARLSVINGKRVVGMRAGGAFARSPMMRFFK